MQTSDVLRLFLARLDNYAATITPLHGRMYAVTLGADRYAAVLLPCSFDHYRLRYHLADEQPELIICFDHDTVVPVPVLSLRAGNFARAYELPETITDIDRQRRTKTGAQVLLGMYLSGMRAAQSILSELPASTRRRYLHKAKQFGRRKRSRPVNHRRPPAEQTTPERNETP